LASSSTTIELARAAAVERSGTFEAPSVPCMAIPLLGAH
jgi:hypothetical protein